MKMRERERGTERERKRQTDRQTDRQTGRPRPGNTCHNIDRFSGRPFSDCIIYMIDHLRTLSKTIECNFLLNADDELMLNVLRCHLTY